MAVPRRGAPDPELCLYQYAAIDKFTHLNFLAVYRNSPPIPLPAFFE